DRWATEALGLAYWSGELGVERDGAEAVRWLRKGDKSGNVDATKNLAICFETGDGVEKDAAEAVRLYRKAAEKGNVEAARRLGLRLLADVVDEEKETETVREGVRWTRRAAQWGDADASYFLGVLC
ncbi:MAG: sel1 repeat family protein, partial [Thermoguttaceae bacterium]|nr:sel1 repeat family protein [Thermoguttaceae bacterium]